MIIIDQPRDLFTFSIPRVLGAYPQVIRLEQVVTSPNYDPTGVPLEPSPKQYDTEQYDPGQYGMGQPGSSSTVDTAKSEAVNVKDTAVDAAAGVKDVAKSEASNMAEEAKYQARSLLDQTRSELRGQAGNQQSALAAKLHGWASELGSMASKADESGSMTDLAQEASRRVGEISHWLDDHEPADLLDEVKRFARRRPVAFLALAAAAGVVAGRVTRGAVAANTSVDSDRESTPARAYEGRADEYDTAPGGTTYGTRSYQDGDYTPRYGETVASGATYRGASTGPTGALPDTGVATPGQYSTGETFPPPVEGEVRR